MRWFRRHIGWGSRLALFALATQLVLSFAHVHVAELGQPQQAVAAAAPGGGPGGAPTQKSDGPIDPGCAICALIQLAATATPSAAPALPPLVATAHSRLEVADQYLLVSSPQVFFRARAPPVG